MILDMVVQYSVVVRVARAGARRSWGGGHSIHPSPPPRWMIIHLGGSSPPLGR